MLSEIPRAIQTIVCTAAHRSRRRPTNTIIVRAAQRLLLAPFFGDIFCMQDVTRAVGSEPQVRIGLFANPYLRLLGHVVRADDRRPPPGKREEPLHDNVCG